MAELEFPHVNAASSNIPARIDLEQIRQWRQICQTTHGDGCNNRHSELLVRHLDELTLIDVESLSLATLPSHTPYVALSYVWGNVSMLKAFQSNLGDLKQPGALQRHAGSIPDTIRDAIHLVKSVGERYLWVDCLCIVQDQEEEEMEKMLQAMAYIYASAEFVIAAANGSDASYGLRGVGGPSQERESRPSPYDRPTNFHYPWGSVWASRGWTFQESWFARRLLVFEATVNWICERCIWHENTDVQEKTDLEPTENNSMVDQTLERKRLGVPVALISLVSELPDLDLWKTLVIRYTYRKLTFESDITRAIAGATSVLALKFPGGVTHGVPIFFLDVTLLWQPSWQISRRDKQPSWSWLGWRGRLELDRTWRIVHALPSASTGQYKDWTAPVTLRPAATYQVLPMSISGSTLEQTNQNINGFYRYQALRSDAGAPLPPGWRRHQHKDGNYFTYTLSKKSQKRYSYPLPIELAPNPPYNGSGILLCTAPLARLDIQVDHSVIGLSSSRILHHGKTIGTILMHDEEFSETTINISCELVALSTGEVIDEERVGFEVQLYLHWIWHELIRLNTLEQDAGEKGVGTESWSYHNVMCIGWEGDTAYRRGIGMVLKTCWDALETETKTFKLG